MRAYILVGEDLREAFCKSQGNEELRYLVVTINEENTLVLSDGGMGKTNGESEAIDFDSMPSKLCEKKPAIVLFKLDRKKEEWGGPRWLLISWMPEASQVRQKMLFSSSIRDLKEGLGVGYFASEFHATDSSELKYCLYKNRGTQDNLLTENERAQRDMRVSDNIGQNLKSNAMGVIPFQPSSEVIQALQSFRNKETDFVKMSMGEKESIVLQASSLIGNAESLKEHLNSLHPEFIVYQYPSGGVLFIFNRPEAASIQDKMVAATARATVATIVKNEGILYNNSFEVNGPEELDEVVAHEVSSRKEENIMNGQIPHVAHRTPTRPGRGRSRLTARKC
eukprot:455617_1